MRNLLSKIRSLLRSHEKRPLAWTRGRLGEKAAAKYLKRRGMKLLVRNFHSRRRGEIDLVLRDGDCLVFAEVKTRSDERWTRPAAAVNRRKRRLLSMASLDYLHAINNPPVKVRFDIVEVMLENGRVQEVRHLPNCFEMESPFRYG